MKLFAAFVVYLVAVWIASSGAQQPNCDNILIRLATQGTWSVGFPFLTTPALTPPNTICGYLVGQESCCDANWFAFLANEWVTVREDMRELQQALDTLVQEEGELNNAEGDYDNAIDNAQDLTADQKTALKNLFKALFSAVDDLISGIQGKFVPCIEELLRYAIGWSCLACRDVEFVNSNGLDTAIINLAEETCTDLGGACAPVLVLLYNFINALQNAFTQYCQAFPNTSCPDLTSDFPCTDLTSCQNVICADWINGFDNTAALGTSFSGSGFAKRNEHIQKYGGPLAVRAMDVLANSKRVFSHKSLQSVRGTTLNVTASYDNSGFQATTVGKSASLDTSAPESASSSQLLHWLNWF